MSYPDCRERLNEKDNEIMRLKAQLQGAGIKIRDTTEELVGAKAEMVFQGMKKEILSLQEKLKINEDLNEGLRTRVTELLDFKEKYEREKETFINQLNFEIEQKEKAQLDLVDYQTQLDLMTEHKINLEKELSDIKQSISKLGLNLDKGSS